MNVTHCRHLRGGHTQMHALTHYIFAPIPNVILPQQDLIYVFRCRCVFSLIYLTNRTCSTLELSGILQNKMDRSREERKGMECNSGRRHFLFRNLRCFFFKYFRRNLPLTSEIPQWFFFSPGFWFPVGKYLYWGMCHLKEGKKGWWVPRLPFDTAIHYCWPSCKYIDIIKEKLFIIVTERHRNSTKETPVSLCISWRKNHNISSKCCQDDWKSER